MLNLREQFNYVNKVVKNCQTQKQKNNAHRWAYDWAKRMKSNYTQLYVITHCGKDVEWHTISSLV